MEADWSSPPKLLTRSCRLNQAEMPSRSPTHRLPLPTDCGATKLIKGAVSKGSCGAELSPALRGFRNTRAEEALRSQASHR
ncbi:hypothetical protein O181_068193 [Austropuccinia psidii MF-1]|uniref:Uncharacterized protein n=1 Tax=Austropuccinia psidii MF-1 TaxID=1389203 RepID=A0A9Q3F005_9BASI|nr:hypothetical protein [Austropuccinia psidii MF-1]